MFKDTLCSKDLGRCWFPSFANSRFYNKKLPGSRYCSFMWRSARILPGNLRQEHIMVSGLRWDSLLHSLNTPATALWDGCRTGAMIKSRYFFAWCPGEILMLKPIIQMITLKKEERDKDGVCPLCI